MQGHFCFIKSPILVFLPDIDASPTCCMESKACLCGPYGTPSKNLKTKKIQVDPVSHDHTFEEFQVKKEFKDDHAFEEFEDKKNSSRSGKLKVGRTVRRRLRLGRVQSLKRVQRRPRLQRVRKRPRVSEKTSFQMRFHFREDWVLWRTFSIGK